MVRERDGCLRAADADLSTIDLPAARTGDATRSHRPSLVRFLAENGLRERVVQQMVAKSRNDARP